MKALIGAGGILAIQGVAQVPTDGTPYVELIKIVIQVILGIASLFHMFKKPSEVISNQNKQ